MTSILIRERETLDTHTGKAMRGHGKEAALCKLRSKKPQEKTTLLAPGPWTSSLQDFEK